MRGSYVKAEMVVGRKRGRLIQQVTRGPRLYKGVALMRGETVEEGRDKVVVGGEKCESAWTY